MKSHQHSTAQHSISTDLNTQTPLFDMFEFKYQQARKLQATLEGCNPKLSITYSLTDGGKV